MSVAKITEKLVTSLIPGQIVWDESVKGFGVRKQTKAAVFVFKYRFKGRQRFKTIGQHGSPWSAETARQAAKRCLLALIDGHEPVGTGDDQPTSLAAFAERYLTQYAASHKKPRTLAEDRRNLDRYILPSLGNLRLDQITRRDIAAFQASHRARPITGNRCLALISHIFNIAEQWEVRPEGSNPCRGLDRFPERPRERSLSADELRRLGDALDRCDRGGGLDGVRGVNWRAVACIRLLILTGARLGEVLGLQWSWINWEQGYVRLPDSKTGPKTVPLPDPALTLLQVIRTRESAVSKYVFTASHVEHHFKAIQKPWRRIRRIAGLTDCHLHDLRRCYAHAAIEAGESLYVVGAILGHRTTATTERYSHIAPESVVRAAGRTAQRLAQLIEPRTQAMASNEPDHRIRPGRQRKLKSYLDLRERQGVRSVQHS